MSADRLESCFRGWLNFVMPAKAGIQVRFRSECKNRLDSGMRRTVTGADYELEAANCSVS